MSSTKDTKVLIIDKDNKVYYGPVGQFIDNLMKKKKEEVLKFDKGNNLMNLTDKDDIYYIIGVSNTEKTSWNKILQISKHPANGGLVKITTLSGKTTTATLTHSFLKRTENSITTIKGSDLKIGDRVPITRKIPEIINPLNEIKIGEKSVKLDKLFGWICGAYISDGRVDTNTVKISKILMEFETNIRKFGKLYDIEINTREYQGEYGPSKDIYFNNHNLSQFLSENFGNGSYNKKIGGFIFASNKEFISGVLNGLFDGDGNINEKRQMIRYGSRSEELINGLCLLASYCGIFGSKLQEKTVNYPDKIFHTFCIQRKYAKQFQDVIGLKVKEKSDELDKIIEYNNRGDKHSDKEDIDKIPELGKTIATIGQLLQLPGQSRLYGRWLKKEAIGRKTLEKYINLFKEENSKITNRIIQDNVNKLICNLEQAANSDVVWDQIVKLEIIDDPKEYVYDFTVPGNDSFMVDEGILVHNTLNTFFQMEGLKSGLP